MWDEWEDWDGEDREDREDVDRQDEDEGGEVGEGELSLCADAFEYGEQEDIGQEEEEEEETSVEEEEAFAEDPDTGGLLNLRQSNPLKFRFGGNL